MAVRSREAYRAVYLASPLKFCTSLHAFTPVLPKFFIDRWEKDFRAWHRHKWRVSRQRKRGKWSYSEGPLSGVRVEGWPDPGLLTASDLAQVASRAQAEGLLSQEFWRALAERSRQLRDVISVSDVAAILDALVTADFRHTDLMRTLSRELIDDVDKLTFVELAVVANSYAHFSCVSEPLQAALAEHTAMLLAGDAKADADPRSLAVVLKAFAKLEYRSEAALSSLNLALVAYAERLPFADLADALVAFAALRWHFVAPASFWEIAALKVPGSRMASLCPALRATALLVKTQALSLQPASAASIVPASTATATAPALQGPAMLRTAVVGEIVSGLRTTSITSTAALPKGANFMNAKGHQEKQAPTFPPFGRPSMPTQMLAAGDVSGHPGEASKGGFGDGFSWGGDSSREETLMGGFALEELPVEAGVAEDSVASDVASPHALKEARWYNPTSRRPFPVASHEIEFALFDASESFSRNRRGALVAEALEGLATIWREERTLATPFVVPAREVELLEAAAPVLCNSVQGLSSCKLAACSEAYALLASSAPSREAADVEAEAIRSLQHEAVRKLSNFTVQDLRKLYDAMGTLGVKDSYLERARRRRFPKALRNELREQAS